MELDMTVGNPLKIIMKFASNCFIGNLVITLYGICDSIIVGNFESINAIAAIGVTTPINFMFMGFISGIASGFSIKFANSYGAKNIQKLKKYEAMSIIVSFIIGILLTISLLIFNPMILKLLNTPNEIFKLANSYLNILYSGIIVTIYLNLLLGLFRAIGDSKTPLYVLIIASVLNIVLDLIFVAVFKMGVNGAAIATVLAQIIALIIAFIVSKKYDILKITLKYFTISYKHIKELLLQGIPMGIQFSITAIGILIVQSALNKYGSNYIAGYSAANKVQTIGIQVYLSLSIALTMFIGQNMGVNNFSRIYKATKDTMKITVFLSVIIMIITYIFKEYFIILFSNEINHDMLYAGVSYFKISIWFYPFLSFIFIFRNSLQGLGHSILALSAGIIELLARGFTILFLEKWLKYFGVCFADPFAWLIAGVSLIFIYYNALRKEKLKYEKTYIRN